MVTLFEDIKLCEGYNRTLVVDLTRGKHYLIPRLWSKLIMRYNRKITNKSIENYVLKTPKRKQLIENILSFLKENELTFECDESLLDSFLPIRKKYNSPSFLDHLYYLVSEKTIEDMIFLMQSNPVQASKIYIYHIIITDFYAQNNNLEKVKMLVASIPYPSMVHICINKKIKKNINFERKDILFETSNGKIDSNYLLSSDYNKRFPIFNIGMQNILLSNSYNPFYYKSLFIDENGTISLYQGGKALHDSVGKKLTIYQLKEKTNIPWSEQKTMLLFWKLPSHKNPICKHCEYHRVCIDNNIPQYVDRGTSFNKKCCIYNPFICKWEGEYGYIKSSFCGTYSDNDFILNTSYIKSTFNKLWNE